MTGNGESGQPRTSPRRRWLGLACVIVAALYILFELLTFRSPAGLILGTVFAVSLAGTGLMLAYPESIPTTWHRSIEGRPWLAAGLMLLAIVALAVLLVIDFVSLYER